MVWMFSQYPCGLAVVTQFQFANACEKTFPSSQRRGGRDINKMLRSILLRSGRGGQTGETKYCAELTTPSAREKVASQLLVDRAATPPLRGGDCSRGGFVHTLQLDTFRGGTVCYRCLRCFEVVTQLCVFQALRGRAGDRQ